jgi:citrate lyase beta subunit
MAYQAFHFARLQLADFSDFYQRVTATGGIVCFDLEDSLSHPDEQFTADLKAQQRQLLQELLCPCPAGLDLCRMGIRINHPASAHYQEDIRLLADLGAVGYVFLPKAETPADIQQVLHDLPRVDQFIPIIESVEGYANVEQLAEFADTRVAAFAFGHCDFNLSSGHFPFFHHDSQQYWQWLAYLDERLHARGKRLINSPVLQLANEELFADVLRRLSSYPSVIGQVTLCLAQTQQCAQAAASPVTSIQPVHQRIHAPAAHAHDTVKAFEQNQLPTQFFAVAANRQLISPQEYRAAHAYLA